MSGAVEWLDRLDALDDSAFIAAAVPAMSAALRAVLARHVGQRPFSLDPLMYDAGLICYECLKPFPCATVRDVADALGGVEP